MAGRPQIGTLERVDLRTLWTNEATEFTPWLAREENIARLSEVLGLDLEVEATEKDVGPFRADILCSVAGHEGHLCLVENQLEGSDHRHLGQILTYAAGLQATTVVWIAERILEDHRAALDWLNEKMAGRINFFGLEIELWRIGDSPVAPKFNIVSKPNDWSSRVTQAAASVSELTETKKLQLEYWEAFAQHLRQHSKVLKPQKPLPQHWTNLTIGRSHFWITASQKAAQDGWIAVELHIGGPHAKEFYRMLEADRVAIERDLGFALVWDPLEGKKEVVMWQHLEHQNTLDRSAWPQQHAWLRERLEKMHAAFHNRIRALELEDLVV